MKRLYAVPFGEDGVDGDSEFYFEPFQIKGGATFEDLLKQWLKKEKIVLPEEVKPSESFTDEDVFGDDLDRSLPVGFWIIDTKLKNAIIKATDVNIGSDSTCYMVNRFAKMMCKAMCVEEIWRGT